MPEDINRIPSWAKFWLSLLAAALILPLVLWGGYTGYKKWNVQRLTKRAEVFFDKGDYRNAALSAKRALDINWDNTRAARIMARVTDKIGSPATLMWRRRVSELAPDSLKDRLDWAECALRFGETTLAGQILSTVPETGRDSAEYHSMAGSVAVGSNKFDEAERHFSRAVKFAPENKTFRFQHAAAQVLLNHLESRREARAELEGLCADKEFRVRSLRMLTKDSLANGELKAALKSSGELVNEPQAVLNDHLIHLDLLHRTNSFGFPTFLNALETRTAKTPEDAGMLLEWMHGHDMSQQAVDWAAKLPPEILSTGPVGAALAMYKVETRDWDGLRDLLNETNWENLNYLRLAFLARALREAGDENGCQGNWSAAISAALKQRNATRNAAKMLASLGLSWKWKDEVNTLLWAVAAEPVDQRWALDLLYQNYAPEGNTHSLLRVVTRMVDLSPSDEAAKNNLAMYSLLLKTNVEKAFAIASELYLKHPSEPAYISTYAYALYVKKRFDEALQVMNTMRSAQLESPGTAMYYGVILAAAGAPEVAKKYLELGETAPFLLPEEKEVLAECRGQLR